MKKMIRYIISFVLLFLLFGCNTNTVELFDTTTYELTVGDTLALHLKDGLTEEEVNFSIEDPEVISIDNGIVTALKHGKTNVEAIAKKDNVKYKSMLTFEVLKKELALFEKSNYLLTIGDKITLNPKDNINVDDINYEIKNQGIISIENGVVSSLKVGEVLVETSYENESNIYKSSLTFTVDKKQLELFEKTSYELIINQKVNLSPKDNIAHSDISYKINNPSLVSLENGELTSLGYGETTIEATYENETCKYNSVLTIKINKKNEALFENNIYEVMMKDTLLLTPIAGVEIKDIEFNIEDENIISIENGLVTPLKVGETFVGLETKDVQSSILIKVTPYKITVKDVESNTLIYNELKEKIDLYEVEMENSNSIQYEYSLFIQGQGISQLTKIRKDQIYVEVFDKYLNQSVIIKEINGIVYLFSSVENHPNAYLLDYLAEADEYENEYSTEGILGVMFSPEKGNIVKQDNIYCIEAYLIDCLDEESKKEIEELFVQEMYEELGLDPNIIFNSIVNIVYEFDGNNLNMSIQIEVYAPGINPEFDTLETTISYNFSLDDFEMFDEENPDYLIEEPSSYYEVYKETDVLDEGISFADNFNSTSEKYLKFYLEKGQYYLYDSNRYCNIRSLEIVDQDMDLVEFNHQELLQSSYLEYMVHSFYIPEDGYYYMCIKPVSYSSELWYRVQKVDYDKSPFDIIENNPSTMTGDIEGFGDIDYYTFTNDTVKNKIIKITNKGEEAAYIACSRYGQSYFFNETILPNKFNYFLIKPGENKFLVTHKSGFINGLVTEELSYSYNLEVEEMNYEYGIGQDGQNLEKITNEFSEGYYMVGYGLEDSYMTIEVEEYGYYVFVPEFLSEDMYFQTKLFDSEGNHVSYNVLNEFELTPGVYKVRLTSNDHVFGIFRIKYTFESLEDKEVEVELPSVEATNLMFTIQNQKVTQNHRVKYVFTLEESSTLIYDIRDLYIYEYDTNKLVSISSERTDSFYNTIVLKPGKYYVEAPDMHAIDFLRIRIAILLSYEDDNKNDFYNPKVLNENEVVILNKDWDQDNEVLKIVITEESKIYFSYMPIYLFDSNLNYVDGKNVDGKFEYTLEPGEYYLFVTYNQNTIAEISYSK